MERNDFLRCSFAATIAYGLAALLGLLIAALWLGSYGSARAALIAIGSAYLSQHLTTWGATEARPGGLFEMMALALQLTACAFFVVGLLFL